MHQADPAIVIPIPQIDYRVILVLALWMGFFIRGARMDMRSPLLWGALSLGSWLVFTWLMMGGLLGGCVSQLLLIAALTGWEEFRERRKLAEAEREREQAKRSAS